MALNTNVVMRFCVDCGQDSGDPHAYRCTFCHITWKHKYQAKLIASDPSYCYCKQHRARASAVRA